MGWVSTAFSNVKELHSLEVPDLMPQDIYGDYKGKILGIIGYI